MNTSYDGLGASAEVVTCPGQRRAEVKVLTVRGLGAICLVLLKAGSSRFPRKRGVEKQLRKYVLLWTRSAKRGHLTLLFRLPYGCHTRLPHHKVNIDLVSPYPMFYVSTSP